MLLILGKIIVNDNDFEIKYNYSFYTTIFMNLVFL